MNDDIFTLNGKKSLTIVLDRTASMANTLEALQNFLPMYVIRRCAADLEQMSLVTFDDHYRNDDSPYADERKRFGPVVMPYGTTENLEEYIYWLKTVAICGGDDLPEAIACALHTARAIDPHASIWLVTNAVPHGANLDLHADQFRDGCPCKTPLNLDGVSVVFTPEYPEAPDAREAAAYWAQAVEGRVVEVSDFAGKLQEQVKVEA